MFLDHVGDAFPQFGDEKKAANGGETTGERRPVCEDC
jgi:hypothetical protein